MKITFKKQFLFVMTLFLLTSFVPYEIFSLSLQSQFFQGTAKVLYSKTEPLHCDIEDSEKVIQGDSSYKVKINRTSKKFPVFSEYPQLCKTQMEKKNTTEVKIYCTPKKFPVFSEYPQLCKTQMEKKNTTEVKIYCAPKKSPVFSEYPRLCKIQMEKKSTTEVKIYCTPKKSPIFSVFFQKHRSENAREFNVRKVSVYPPFCKIQIGEKKSTAENRNGAWGELTLQKIVLEPQICEIEIEKKSSGEDTGSLLKELSQLRIALEGKHKKLLNKNAKLKKINNMIKKSAEQQRENIHKIQNTHRRVKIVLEEIKKESSDIYRESESLRKSNSDIHFASKLTEMKDETIKRKDFIVSLTDQSENCFRKIEKTGQRLLKWSNCFEEKNLPRMIFLKQKKQQGEKDTVGETSLGEDLKVAPSLETQELGFLEQLEILELEERLKRCEEPCLQSPALKRKYDNLYERIQSEKRYLEKLKFFPHSNDRASDEKISTGSASVLPHAFNTKKFEMLEKLRIGIMKNFTKEIEFLESRCFTENTLPLEKSFKDRTQQSQVLSSS